MLDRIRTGRGDPGPHAQRRRPRSGSRGATQPVPRGRPDLALRLPVLTGTHARRRHVRGAAQHRRRAGARACRASPMSSAGWRGPRPAQEAEPVHDPRGRAPATVQKRAADAMKTAITDMFGIDVPILAFSHCRDVVAAVSKAGGMGVLGAVAHSQRQLEIDLDWIEDEIGDRPYGVDLIVPAKYAGLRRGRVHARRRPGADPARAHRVRRRHPPPLRRARPARRRQGPWLRRRPRRSGRAVLGRERGAEPRDRAGPPQCARRQRPRSTAGAHDRAGQGGGPPRRRPGRARRSTPSDTSTPVST